MALESGTRVGIYEVTAKIGEGGMGEVYQARDTTLDRDVALKVLPEAFTADPDRLARFQREAKVLASLNHSNIGAIYGLEAAGETQALVLELIEGPTLADRIAEGPIPVDEALTIAKQIAEALEAAHEQGIIHRDLKPANVKVKVDGTVKVLDFGLAKAVASDTGGGGSTTSATMSLTASATQMGMVIGTAAYMAPEQARGKSVDQRADVWAFGAVLCEMLTGAKAFPGDDVSDTLATVLKSEPAWGDLPDAVPERVRQLLRTCLEKDPRQRLHAVADVRLAMEGAFETRVIAPVEDVLPPQLRVWQQPMPLAAGAFLLLVVGGLSVWGLTSPGPTLVEPVARFSLPLGSDQDFSAVGRHIVALAPNGDYVVYSANGQLFTRQLDQLQSTAISGTQGNSSSPFVSPDGEWIGFFAGGQLRKVAVSGGPPVTLCDARNPWGVSWGVDDMVLFGQGPEGIWRVPGTGGTPEVLIAVEDGEQAHGPQMLPGNDWVLFTLRTVGAGGWNEADVVVQSVATGERVVLIEGARDARYVETGHLVYAVNGVLFAVAFDPNARALLGGPVPLVEGVRDATSTAATHFSLSLDGSLVYVPGAAGSVLEFVWVDREGREDPLPLPPRAYFAPRVSPDGTRLAVTVEEQGRDLWVFDVVSAAGLRITDEGTTNAPVWTPDGERIVFSWNQASVNDIFLVSADGSGQAEQLTTSDVNDVVTSVTPDGANVLFARLDSVGGTREVWQASLGDSGMVTPVLQGEFARGNAEVSPDGNWLTYRSNQSGQLEIYLEPYPGPGPTVPVSSGGGDLVTWSTDGAELFYRSGSRLMAVDVRSDGTVGQPVELLDGNYVTAPNGVRQYHVAPDGRFLMMRDATSTTGNENFAQVVLVQNWFKELQERVPVP